MDFRILGPLEVSDDGRQLELGPPKQRALLAILLLRGGEWGSADALIDALWGERPPETARFALHNYVAGLRRALGPERILSRDGGYQLEVEAEQLDLNRFEHLVEESRAADAQERLERLQAALALWRGPALADLLYEPFAGEEARRLEELHTSALEELIDAELAFGEGPELIERLEALIAEHPYRERLRGQMMLALYRGGRQVEALACYRQARETLVEELGIEPGSTLRELEQAILRHDPSLEPPVREQLPPLAERRKIVTVLFAELHFPETLDPELLREASLVALGRVRDVVGAHGAAVEQRASEELLAVFGLPLAHEDDALRAARAALELNAAGAELRLAFESGEVLAGVDEAGHGFVTGAVVPAARHLLEQAGSAEVLAGPLALALLGDTAVVEPAAGSAARLIGLARPVVGAGAPLAGRRDELAALHGAVMTVSDQRRTRLFVLLGEAGIGKTRLAAELARELEGRATIVQGRCLSYGQSLSYWPLVEVLRALGDPARKALDRLLSGGATSPQQLAWSVYQALAGAATERPLLVLVEDLHWAEPALLELLAGLSKVPGEAPILMLCLARTELIEQHPEWAEHESLLLQPLPRADAGALLDARLDRPEPRQRERILARAAGNPLFLEELSAFLAEGGEERQLPPRLQVLLQARLEQLPEPQRLVLAAAALEGTVFYGGALGTLAAEELAALVKTALIRPVPAELEGEECYRFRHELIRDAAYGALPKTERARLHQGFADWLATHAGDRSELEDVVAYHLEQAALTRRELETGDAALESRAGAALAAAADRARRRAALHAAVDLWRRALVLLDECDPRTSEVQLEAGWVLGGHGAFDEARLLLERAEQCTTDPTVIAAIRVTHLRKQLSRDPQGAPAVVRRECAQALPLFQERGEHRWLARACFVLALADLLELRMRESKEACEKAADHARIAGDHTFEMLVLEQRTFFQAGTRTSYAAEAREGERLVSRFPGEPFAERCLDLHRAFGAFDRGRPRQARSLARKGIAAFREGGYLVNAAQIEATVGRFELLGGNCVEAERLALSAIHELEELKDREYLGLAQALLAEVRVAQGRPHEALAVHVSASGKFAWILAVVTQARAYLGLADLEQAEAAATEAVTLAEKTDSIDHQAEAQCVLAEVHSAAGRFSEALRAAENAASLWRTLDRRLRGAYAAGLIAKIKQSMAAHDVPAGSL